MDAEPREPWWVRLLVWLDNMMSPPCPDQFEHDEHEDGGP